MFIGHFAVGLASKSLAPRASLGWLVAACEFVDLLWPVFLIGGWERVRIDPGNTAFTPIDFVHYPYTHSLLMSVFWGLFLGWVYFGRAKDRRGALIIGAVVVSHWVLDWITHRPDLPLYPGSPKHGLGLWNSVSATLVVELGMFTAGVVLYARAAKPVDRKGRIAFWSFVAFLLLTYVANILGGPPPNVVTIEVSALLLWLLVFWAAWIDKHRRFLAASPSAEHP